MVSRQTPRTAPGRWSKNDEGCVGQLDRTAVARVHAPPQCLKPDEFIVSFTDEDRFRTANDTDDAKTQKCEGIKAEPDDENKCEQVKSSSGLTRKQGWREKGRSCCKSCAAESRSCMPTVWIGMSRLYRKMKKVPLGEDVRPSSLLI